MTGNMGALQVRHLYVINRRNHPWSDSVRTCRAAHRPSLKPKLTTKYCITCKRTFILRVVLTNMYRVSLYSPFGDTTTMIQTTVRALVMTLNYYANKSTATVNHRLSSSVRASNYLERTIVRNDNEIPCLYYRALFRTNPKYVYTKNQELNYSNSAFTRWYRFIVTQSAAQCLFSSSMECTQRFSYSSISLWHFQKSPLGWNDSCQHSFTVVCFALSCQPPCL